MCLVNALDATELYKEEMYLGKRIDSFYMNVGDAAVRAAWSCESPVMLRFVSCAAGGGLCSSGKIREAQD